jgi:lysophospholipase L1-like esterase
MAMTQEGPVTNKRDQLTPQMRIYDNFLDRGDTSWLPYLMYFHRTNYQSDVVNTDALGFRMSACGQGVTSPALASDLTEPVNLLVGSSVVFGVGASSDAASLPSRLSARTDGSAWLNLGGRGYCSTQELLLFLLNRKVLPRVRNIVLMSGLNDLILTGLPSSLKSEYGAFFFCGDYYSKMEELKTEYQRASGARGPSRRNRWTRPSASSAAPQLPMRERIAEAAGQIARNLDNWQPLAAAMSARLFFVAQSLATWVRDIPAAEEKTLFHELDSRESGFWQQIFGATAESDTGKEYVDALSAASEKRGIPFLNMNSALAQAVRPEQWVFVDRAHFNDAGYQLASQIITDAFELNLLLSSHVRRSTTWRLFAGSSPR